MEELLRAIYQKQRGLKVPHSQRLSYNSVHQRNPRYSIDQINQSTPTQLFHSKPAYQTLESSTQSSRKATYRQHLPRFRSIDHSQNTSKSKQSVKFPSVQKRKNTRKNQKFRAAGLAILFAIRLIKLRKASLLGKKQQAQILASKMDKIILKMVTSYYEPLLQQQITYYLSLFDLRLKNPTLNLDKQILSNIFYTSKKLSQSTIRKDFLQLLKSLAFNECFIPSGFLSEFEMKRLQFSTKYGSIKNVKRQQTRMIIGIFIGIKILCSFIIYRPWSLKLWNYNTKQVFETCQSLISEYGSIYYLTIMQQFNKLPPILCDPTQKHILSSFYIQPMQKVSIYPSEFSQKNNFNKSTQTDLIPNQHHVFYKRLQRQYPEQMQKIKHYLIKWIDRITNVVIKDFSQLTISKKGGKDSKHISKGSIFAF